MSLEDLDTRSFAEKDLHGQPAAHGEFVLTGSQPFGLLSHITHSVAGRVGLVQLLPFAVQELQAAQLDCTSGPATPATLR